MRLKTILEGLLNYKLTNLFLEDIGFNQEQLKANLRSEEFVLRFENGCHLLVGSIGMPHWRLNGELDIKFFSKLAKSDEQLDFLQLNKDVSVVGKLRYVKLYYSSQSYLDRQFGLGRLVQIEFYFGESIFSVGYFCHKGDGHWEFLYTGEICVTINSSLNDALPHFREAKLTVKQIG
jgi:hypothetical protein